MTLTAATLTAVADDVDVDSSDEDDTNKDDEDKDEKRRMCVEGLRRSISLHTAFENSWTKISPCEN